MSDAYNGARHSKIAIARDRFRRSGAPKTCIVVAMCIGTITNAMAGGRSQSVPDRPAFDPPTLTMHRACFTMPGMRRPPRWHSPCANRAPTI
jgi:hypothetical protein